MMIEDSKYKDQLFSDLWNCKIPKRVPINQTIDLIYALEYSKYSLLTEQYSMQKCYEAIDNIAPRVDTDIYPIGTSKNVVAIKIMGSEVWQMGKDGFLQHPNFAPMKDDEYSWLINNFEDFDKEMDIRSNRNYQCSEEERLLVKLRVDASNARYFAAYFANKKKIEQNHNLSSFEHVIGLSGGPFDQLANNYRSFTGALNDIRRKPEEVLQAVKIFTEETLRKIDLMPQGEDGGRIFMPLHMATFMKEKDFVKFWWPFFKEVIDYCAKTNRRIWLFCEDNWDRYMEYLQGVPDGALMAFEYTDAKLAKEKLGKNHILSGFYPIQLYKSATTQECSDEAKKLLDIVAPGGGYMFKSDKYPITMADAKLENIEAVLKTVKEYGRY